MHISSTVRGRVPAVGDRMTVRFLVVRLITVLLLSGSTVVQAQPTETPPPGALVPAAATPTGAVQTEAYFCNLHGFVADGPLPVREPDSVTATSTWGA